MGAFLKREGCKTVGFEKSMWRVVIDSHQILLGVHINDFVFFCANRPILDAFHKRLLEALEGTYEGPLEHYLGCEVARDPVAGLPRRRQHYSLSEALCGRDFAIAWILGYSTVQHTYKNTTVAFQKTIATPTPNKTSKVATVAL